MNSSITKLCLYAIALFMPLNTLITSISIVIVALVQLLSKRNVKMLFKQFEGQKYMFLVVCFFIIKVIGLIYTEGSNLSTGVSYIERNLPFLIFPFFIGKHILSRKIIRNIICTFIISTVICASYSFLILMSDYFSTGINYSPNTYMERYFLLHPTYASLYANVSVAFLLFVFLQGKYVKINLQYLLYSIIVFLSLFIFVSGSRTQIIAFILVIGIYVLHTIINGKGLIKVSVISVLLIVIFSVIFLNSPFLKQKLKQIQSIELDIKTDEKKYNGVEIRLVKWKCALQVIEENIWLGVGTGDSQQELNESYKRNNFWGYVFSYNAHNDFLTSMIKFGIVGLILHVFLFLIPFRKGIKEKQYILSLLVFLFFISSLTESLLNRSHGVILISFFLVVVYHYSNILNEKPVIAEA